MEILLSLGPSFAIPSSTIQKIPYFHLIAEIENILKTNPDTTIQDRTRCTITNSILNHIHHNKHSSPNDDNHRFYKNAIRIVKNFLKNNPDIYVLKSDKGNKTVLMPMQDYQTKMLQLLDNEHTYQRVPRDPTSGF